MSNEAAGNNPFYAPNWSPSIEQRPTHHPAPNATPPPPTIPPVVGSPTPIPPSETLPPRHEEAGE